MSRTLQEEIETVEVSLSNLEPRTPEYERKCWELYDSTRFTINDLLNWKSIDKTHPEFLQFYKD